jgi:hypothetical protein
VTTATLQQIDFIQRIEPKGAARNYNKNGWHNLDFLEYANELGSISFAMMAL